MAKRRSDNKTRLLPGIAAPVRRTRDDTLVEIPLQLASNGTPDAWHLRAGKAAPKWAPRKLVTRGEGLKAGFFTLPRWVALDRGWLR